MEIVCVGARIMARARAKEKCYNHGNMQCCGHDTQQEQTVEQEQTLEGISLFEELAYKNIHMLYQRMYRAQRERKYMYKLSVLAVVMKSLPSQDGSVIFVISVNTHSGGTCSCPRGTSIQGG